jgi:hypothetical protein
VRLRCRTRASHHFGYAIAFPHTHEKHLRAGGVFKDVINVRIAIDFEESGSARIGSQRRAHAEKQTQFRDLLLGMTPKIFQKRRLFVYCHGHAFLRRSSLSLSSSIKT